MMDRCSNGNDSFCIMEVSAKPTNIVSTFFLMSGIFLNILPDISVLKVHALTIYFIANVNCYILKVIVLNRYS